MDIQTNWLDTFRKNLKCGVYPSKTSDPEGEMMTGAIGLLLKYLACRYGADFLTSSCTEQTPNLQAALDRIECGELFTTQGAAWAVIAKALDEAICQCEAT